MIEVLALTVTAPIRISADHCVVAKRMLVIPTLQKSEPRLLGCGRTPALGGPWQKACRVQDE